LAEEKVQNKMSHLLTIEDYFTNLGAKKSIGIELGNIRSQIRMFDIACEQNRRRIFPIASVQN
jgi:hypothetical protein